MADNPFTGLRAETHDAIEKLLSRIHGQGDWDDGDEEMLAQWREARGDEAMTDWRWWVGYPGCESYSEDADTREKAIEIGKREYADEGSIEIIEARCWSDIVKDGDEISWFAESRNKEVISVGEGAADA